MRTLVDIPEPQLRQLAAICKAKGLPRAEVVRQAIAAYIGTNKTESDAFGLWGERKIDGLEYQEKLRAEW